MKKIKDENLEDGSSKYNEFNLNCKEEYQGKECESEFLTQLKKDLGSGKVNLRGREYYKYYVKDPTTDSYRWETTTLFLKYGGKYPDETTGLKYWP